MIDMSKPQWYIICASTGYDYIVRDNILRMVESSNLQDYIFDVVVPEVEEVVEKEGGKKKFVMRRKYPNYVFIKMIYTKQIWYMVRNTRGVRDFCTSADGKPLPMSPEDVKKAQLEKVKAEDLHLQVGDQVHIISGPRQDFLGEVKEIKLDTQKVKVSVSMFGRDTSVELEFGQVEKLI